VREGDTKRFSVFRFSKIASISTTTNITRRWACWCGICSTASCRISRRYQSSSRNGNTTFRRTCRSTQTSCTCSTITSGNRRR
jgi:hypothetical protein